MRLTRRKLLWRLPAATALAVAGLYLGWPNPSMYGIGRSRSRPVESDAELPARADVVIIGAGDIGVFTALCLAERGLTVALCEKGVVAGEASGRSLGWIESLLEDPVTAPLMVRSKELYPGLSERIGEDSTYRCTGLSMLCIDEAQREAVSKWIDLVRGEPGFDAVYIDRQRSAELVGSPANSWIGAIWQPSDGIAEPRILASAVAEGARRHGATIHQQCAVRGLELAAGRINAVVTERGPIRTDKVVYAGGYWTSAFCHNLGVSIPQLPMIASLISLAPFPGAPKVSSMHGITGWRVESDGGITLGRPIGLATIESDSFRYGWRFARALWDRREFVRPAIGSDFWRSLGLATHWQLDERSPFELMRILEPRPWRDLNEAAYADLKASLPAFAQSRPRSEWAGVLTDLPDGLPVLSAIPQIPGLLIATGMGNALSSGPAVGELLADLVMGTTPRVDPKPFRVERLERPEVLSTTGA